MVWGSNPGGREIFHTCPDRPWVPPSLLCNGYRVFPWGKERSGRDTDPSPTSSAAGHERVELYLDSPYGPYGLYRASVPVQGCTFYLFLQYTRTESQPFVVFVRTVLCLMVLSVSQTTTRMASNSCVIGMNVIGYWRKPLWICMNI